MDGWTDHLDIKSHESFHLFFCHLSQKKEKGRGKRVWKESTTGNTMIMIERNRRIGTTTKQQRCKEVKEVKEGEEKSMNSTNKNCTSYLKKKRRRIPMVIFIIARFFLLLSSLLLLSSSSFSLMDSSSSRILLSSNFISSLSSTFSLVGCHSGSILFVLAEKQPLSSSSPPWRQQQLSSSKTSIEQGGQTPSPFQAKVQQQKEHREKEGEEEEDKKEERIPQISISEKDDQVKEQIQERKPKQAAKRTPSTTRYQSSRSRDNNQLASLLSSLEEINDFPRYRQSQYQQGSRHNDNNRRQISGTASTTTGYRRSGQNSSLLLPSSSSSSSSSYSSWWSSWLPKSFLSSFNTNPMNYLRREQQNQKWWTTTTTSTTRATNRNRRNHHVLLDMVSMITGESALVDGETGQVCWEQRTGNTGTSSNTLYENVAWKLLHPLLFSSSSSSSSTSSANTKATTATTTSTNNISSLLDGEDVVLEHLLSLILTIGMTVAFCGVLLRWLWPVQEAKEFFPTTNGNNDINNDNLSSILSMLNNENNIIDDDSTSINNKKLMMIAHTIMTMLNFVVRIVWNILNHIALYFKNQSWWWISIIVFLYLYEAYTCETRQYLSNAISFHRNNNDKTYNENYTDIDAENNSSSNESGDVEKEKIANEEEEEEEEGLHDYLERLRQEPVIITWNVKIYHYERRRIISFITTTFYWLYHSCFQPILHGIANFLKTARRSDDNSSSNILKHGMDIDYAAGTSSSSSSSSETIEGTTTNISERNMLSFQKINDILAKIRRDGFFSTTGTTTNDATDDATDASTTTMDDKYNKGKNIVPERRNRRRKPIQQRPSFWNRKVITNASTTTYKYQRYRFSYDVDLVVLSFLSSSCSSFILPLFLRFFLFGIVVIVVPWQVFGDVP